MYVIRNVNMANYLLTNGNQLVKIDIDNLDKRRLVFLFNDSTELRNCMSLFSKDGGSKNDSIENGKITVERK